MKVLLISTCESSGGGAIAARRLMEALNKNGVEAKLMVRDKQSDDPRVVKVGGWLPKLLERLSILPHCGFRRSRLWQADIANFGISITRTKEFQEADVVHLHWVNQGMLSLDEMGKIMSSGKRIVWTLHDEWPYLGVCHYRGECKQEKCQKCHIMSGITPYYIYMRKRAMYERWHPAFVGCSRWITNEAQKALPSEWVTHVNNCIPSEKYHSIDKKEAREALGLPKDKRLVLFCSQKVTDERKGIKYLIEALQLLKEDDLSLIIVGKDSEKLPLPESIEAFRFGSVSEQKMPLLYNAADAFVTPSLQDNLPNTIAEAMSCGTPCIGFNIGGIPEMIDHTKNGYVARYQDAADLAEGIRFVLSHDLCAAARSKASVAYNETEVAELYTEIYEG